jgi:ketosteroid isomerase-like protein
MGKGAAKEPEPTRSPEKLIRRAYRAFAERDIETLARLSAEEVEVSTVTGLMSGRTEPYRGREGLEQYMEDLASTWKRIELQPQNFQALDDERILVFGRVRAWHEAGMLDASNAWLWTVRDDRVAAVQVFADPGEARRLSRSS